MSTPNTDLLSGQALRDQIAAEAAGYELVATAIVEEILHASPFYIMEHARKGWIEIVLRHIKSAIEKETELICKERDAWKRVANWDVSSAAPSSTEAPCSAKPATQGKEETQGNHASEPPHLPHKRIAAEAWTRIRCLIIGTPPDISFPDEDDKGVSIIESALKRIDRYWQGVAIGQWHKGFKASRSAPSSANATQGNHASEQCPKCDQLSSACRCDRAAPSSTEAGEHASEQGDALKLRLLAEWIDLKYPNDCDPQVQNDLRRIADYLSQRAAPSFARVFALRSLSEQSNDLPGSWQEANKDPLRNEYNA